MKESIVISMIYWDCHDDQSRRLNIGFCWQKLNSLVRFLVENGINSRAMLYDFSETTYLSGAVHMPSDPDANGHFSKSSKINQVLEHVGQFAPHIFALFDADVFIPERYYDQLVKVLADMSSDEYYVIGLRDILNVKDCVDFATCSINYELLKYRNRAQNNGVPGLGGAYFVPYEKLLQAGGYDERFTC